MLTYSSKHLAILYEMFKQKYSSAESAWYTVFRYKRLKFEIDKQNIKSRVFCWAIQLPTDIAFHDFFLIEYLSEQQKWIERLGLKGIKNRQVFFLDAKPFMQAFDTHINFVSLLLLFTKEMNIKYSWTQLCNCVFEVHFWKPKTLLFDEIISFLGLFNFA